VWVFNQVLNRNLFEYAYSTRSPAIARMADRTAPVIKLTLNLTGHNLAKTGTPLKWAHYEAKEAYRTIFCSLKTTSGFIFLLPVV